MGVLIPQKQLENSALKRQVTSCIVTPSLFTTKYQGSDCYFWLENVLSAFNWILTNLT